MPDHQQRDLLGQGVTAWNSWREQHQDIYLDLSRANLRGANLREANLRGADLSGADLRGADLSETDFRGADLRGADLSGADLRGANLINANLSRADLSRANLRGANLRGANLSGANLNNSDFINADLINANLRGAYLSRADFRGANLRGADLSGAILINAYLINAYLSGADLSGADLSRAILRTADLREANLSRAGVGGTIFGDVDLRTVKGLDTLDHHAPSTIGTDTLLRSQGNIPEKFLREVGLSDTFITYTRSLTQNPIDYYTCFISYSSQDQEFVERLYTDLQAKGIRCWFAPEDLKIGEEFPNRIEEAIRLYDKLLVILSQLSVKSPWVEDEVRAAVEKEERFKREQRPKAVLFPITIDDAMEQEQAQWVAMMRRKRHIGDFIGWKDHDTYQKGLKRLLRDLHPDGPPTNKP